MTQSKRRRFGAYALSLVAWPALNAAADEGLDAQRVLPTVVVTAQKTKQTLEQVPASVSTIDGDFIKQIGALDVDTLQNYSGNVSISMGTSSAQVSVRGLGTPNSNQASDPSVGTVVDGVFYGRSSFATAFLDDLDRFEVLRGPQGTLFGKNSTAGLLNVTTRAPEQEPSARIEVLTAGYGQRTYRPMLNLPMMPGVAVRFSGNYSDSDGVLYNTYLNRDERNPKIYTSRLRISVEPVAGWRGDLEGFVSNQYQNFNIFKITQASPAMTALIQQYDPNFDQNPNSHRNSSNVPSREQGHIGGANLTLSHDMGGTWGIRNLEMTSVTAYGEQFTSARDLDADFTPIPFIRDTLREPSPYRQFSQELRFAGDHPDLFGWGHGFSFVTGAYYFNSKFRTSDNFQIERLDAAGQYFTAANAGNQPAFADASYRLLLPVGDLISLINALNVPGVNLDQAARVNLNQRDKAYALFGQAEHFFLPQWAVIAGLRLGLERKDGLASSQSNPLPVIGTIPSTPANVVISQVTGKPVSCGVSLVSLIADQCNHVTAISDLERDFSPKLGVKWSPDKNRSAYATFSRGYKSGGFNALPLSPDNLQFGPERATSYEIGAKTRLLGGSMNISAAAFSTDFDNLQISSFQNNSFVILNAAAARSRGFEVDTRWLTPVVGLSLLSSVGFADARYISYPNAPAKADSKPGDPGTFSCPSSSGNNGSSLPTNSGSACQDLSGKPLAFAPKWTASLVPSYSRNVDSLGLVATFAVDVLYRSSRYLDVDDDPRKLQPSTTILNARAIVGRPDDNWTLSVAAQNITNQVVFDQVVGQPLAPGNFAAVRTDRGRYYTAALTLNFN